MGGRGPNAPKIGALEAAKFLIAVAGSPKGNDAPARLEKLQVLRGANKRTLLEALQHVLMSDEARQSITELRIARTRSQATFIAKDLSWEEYLPPKKRLRSGRFYVAGILDTDFLDVVAAALAGRSVEAGEADPEDD